MPSLKQRSLIIIKIYLVMFIYYNKIHYHMENRYSKEIKADRDAYYLSCPEVVAKHIASNLSKFNTAVELCCCVGMLSIQLAKVMDKVYAIDFTFLRWFN